MELKVDYTVKDHKMRVKHLMTTDLVTLDEDDTLKTVEEVMGWRKIRHIPVVNAAKELVGLVTHRDFLNVAVSRLAEMSETDKTALYRSVPIKQIMNKVVLTVGPDAPIEVAAKTMVENKIGCLFVVNEQELLGIITESDFVKAFYQV